MTGSLVAQIQREAEARGLSVSVRSFPDVVENVNGADLGIAISGPAHGGGRTTKGFIAQAKRDDEPKRLSKGVGELKAPRGSDGRSQLERLRDHRAGAVVVYGPTGVRAVPVNRLPAEPTTADVRDGGRGLPQLIGDVLQCSFGLEGDRVWDLMGLTPTQRPRVSLLAHIEAR
jgi:hypothetical protein